MSIRLKKQHALQSEYYHTPTFFEERLWWRHALAEYQLSLIYTPALGHAAWLAWKQSQDVGGWSERMAECSAFISSIEMSCQNFQDRAGPVPGCGRQSHTAGQEVASLYQHPLFYSLCRCLIPIHSPQQRSYVKSSPFIRAYPSQPPWHQESIQGSREEFWPLFAERLAAYEHRILLPLYQESLQAIVQRWIFLDQSFPNPFLSWQEAVEDWIHFLSDVHSAAFPLPQEPEAPAAHRPVPLPDTVLPQKSRGAQRSYRAIASLLSLQKTCPFKALAVIGLGLKEQYTQSLGWSPPQQGRILHKTLDIFWKKCQSSAHLFQLSADEQQRLLKQALKEASLHERPETTGLDASAQGYAAKMQDIEQHRMLKTLTKWLHKERERGPFECLGTEVPLQLTLLGHPFSLRIDRIDRIVSTQGVEHDMIIDYKSSQSALASFKDLIHNPALSPQLPLYCLAYPQATVALYAIIVPAFSKMQGIISAEKETLALSKQEAHTLGVEPYSGSWAGLLEDWRLALESTLEDYIQGDQAPAPREGAKTCRGCHVADLCRMQQRF